MTTKAKPNPRPMMDAYLVLVKEFPLESIRDADHFQAAEAMIDRLLRIDRDEGAEAYLGALCDLVSVYDDEHFAVPDASEGDVLRELMDGNRLTQAQLAAEVGISQSTISSVLTGTRSLTKAQVVKLARRFNVPAEVFLPK